MEFLVIALVTAAGYVRSSLRVLEEGAQAHPPSARSGT